MRNAKNNPARRPRAAKCPICGKAVGRDSSTFPFCGDRCRLIDLGKWVRGDYVISRPVERSDLEEGE